MSYPGLMTQFCGSLLIPAIKLGGGKTLETDGGKSGMESPSIDTGVENIGYLIK